LTPNLAEAAALLGEDVATNEDEMTGQGARCSRWGRAPC